MRSVVMVGKMNALLKDRMSLIEGLHQTYNRYAEALGELQLEGEHLLERANQYARLLEEHLWLIPSSPPIGRGWSAQESDI